MSQNVALKKIQVANRQKQASELFLKNISVTKISQIFGVDRRTVQRDLQQVKFSFGRSVPSEQAYKLLQQTNYEHNWIYGELVKHLNKANTHEQSIAYIKIIQKHWTSKAILLSKIGIFDCIASMLDEKHDLANESILIKEEKKKEPEKPNKKFITLKESHGCQKDFKSKSL